MGSHVPPNKGKGLEDLMMAYTDLSSKTKSSGFRGPPVKDLKTNNMKSASTFQTSNKSRDWSTFNMDLETAFSPQLSNPQTVSQPPPFVAQPQLLQQKPVVNQPAFIHPQQPASLQPTQAQDTDDWGDFQDFSAPKQPLSLPQNPFTSVNPPPNLLQNLTPVIHQASNLPNFQPMLNPTQNIFPPNISSTQNVMDQTSIEPKSDFDDFEDFVSAAPDFVSAPPLTVRPVAGTFLPKSSPIAAVSLPATKDLRMSEQFSEAIGSRLATFQDESPVHRFKSSPMPQATQFMDSSMPQATPSPMPQATLAPASIEDDFGDFSLPTISSIPVAVSLLSPTPRSDSSMIPASDKYSAFRDFLDTSDTSGAAASSMTHPKSPSPCGDLLNTSADTLIAQPSYKSPPDPFSLLSPPTTKQSPNLSLNTSAEILLTSTSISNNDDFGDFADFESATPFTNPFSMEVSTPLSPDDEWSLPGGGPPPLPDITPSGVRSLHSSAWVSSSPPPAEYSPAKMSRPVKMSHLDVEDFALPSDQLELTDRELFGTRLYEEPAKKATANSLQGVYNLHLTSKTNPVEDFSATETNTKEDISTTKAIPEEDIFGVSKTTSVEDFCLTKTTPEDFYATKTTPEDFFSTKTTPEDFCVTTPVEDSENEFDKCSRKDSENEFDKCCVTMASPSRDKSSSPDSMLSSLPVPRKSSETQSVASLEFESPVESKSRHGSIVSLELNEARSVGGTSTNPFSKEASSSISPDDEWSLPPGGRVCGLESPYNEWTLTLAEIAFFIDTVLEIYSQQGDEVKVELAQSEEGEAYLSNLLEVYKVYKRIATSVKNNGKQEIYDAFLKSQCDHIEESWSRLLLNVPSDCVVFHNPVSSSMSSTPVASSCGLCLLDVGTKGVEPKLCYAGKEYHSGCANFWVNCVDSALPSLAI